MALRTLRTLGDPILDKRSKDIVEITPRIKELIADMKETLVEADGVGLAAVQVGILKRLFIIDIDEERNGVFINPEIVSTEGEILDFEGCLSVPGKSGKVNRPQKVTVKAFDENMKPFTMEVEDLFARAVCHEYDHLDGILYVDRVEGELFDVNNDEDEDEYEEEE